MEIRISRKQAFKIAFWRNNDTFENERFWNLSSDSRCLKTSHFNAHESFFVIKPIHIEYQKCNEFFVSCKSFLSFRFYLTLPDNSGKSHNTSREEAWLVNFVVLCVCLPIPPLLLAWGGVKVNFIFRVIIPSIIHIHWSISNKAQYWKIKVKKSLIL